MVDLYVQFPPAAVCGLRRLYEGAFWAVAADRISDVLWIIDGDGSAELRRDGKERELVEHMRTRSWGLV